MCRIHVGVGYSTDEQSSSGFDFSLTCEVLVQRKYMFSVDSDIVLSCEVDKAAFF